MNTEITYEQFKELYARRNRLRTALPAVEFLSELTPNGEASQALPALLKELASLDDVIAPELGYQVKYLLFDQDDGGRVTF